MLILFLTLENAPKNWILKLCQVENKYTEGVFPLSPPLFSSFSKLFATTTVYFC